MTEDEKTKRERMFEENINLAYKVAGEYIRRYPDEKEEIHQVALMGLWECILTFDESKARLSTYAYTAIRNNILDYIKRKVNKHSGVYSLNKKYEDDITLEDMVADDVNHIEMIENKIEIYYILERIKLTPQDKYVLDLRLEGKSQLEIAKELNLSQANVSRILCKIKAKVKYYLQKKE